MKRTMTQLIGPYTFHGFGLPEEARNSCRRGQRLARMANDVEEAGLRRAIDKAVDLHLLSSDWPKDTIWLGGHWDSRTGRWEWDDGTPVETLRWAKGQPSARGHQQTEPYLCMLLDGVIHDTEPTFSFGIICEDVAGEVPAPLPRWHPPTPPPPPPALPRPQSSYFGGSRYGKLEFMGFLGPLEARAACGVGRRLVAAKNEAEMEELSEAVKQAVKAGEMSETWPQDTIWLGGRWNARMHSWIWDDGSPIDIKLHWGPGQPTATSDQTREPWLCMVNGKDIHDSDPPYSFGVFCQKTPRRPSLRGHDLAEREETADDWNAAPVWQ